LPGRFFLRVVEARFFRGFLGKQCFFDGVFVVKLWWIAGKSWCVDGHFFGSKNISRF
jgi:hypothetical protein